jgi:DNA gyrase subunit A
MYDGGYRPDRNFVKCSRVVGDVMGNYHPHGDSSVYDALVRMAQPWSMRYPLIDPQGNFGSPGNDPPAAMRYTECRLANAGHGDAARHRQGHRRLHPQLRRQHGSEPVILPARFPNLLINGSEGIAVGMATKIPPHNLREVAAGVPGPWTTPTPDEELLEELMRLIKGPDFPTRGLIVGP